MPQKFQLTQTGVEEIKAERDQLLLRREELAKSIAEAREQGDLSENSEYQISREEQDKNEARLAEIENILRNVGNHRAASRSSPGCFGVDGRVVTAVYRSAVGLSIWLAVSRPTRWRARSAMSLLWARPC